MRGFLQNRTFETEPVFSRACDSNGYFFRLYKK